MSMTDKRLIALLVDLFPTTDVHEPDWVDVLRRAERAAAVAPDDSRSSPRRLRSRTIRVRHLALAVTALVAVVGIASAAVVALRPPMNLQNPKNCVSTWNRLSPPARQSAVAQLHPIAAMVVGTGVLTPSSSPRCALLVMKSNGSWYATETPTGTGSVQWSPLRHLQDGIAMEYITGGKPISTQVRVLDTGKLSAG